MNEKTHSWTYLSNHAHVLVCLAQGPDARLRDIAEKVGITERAVQNIVNDLDEAGAIIRTRDGRRNRYDVRLGVALRHPVEAHCTVGDLLDVLTRTTAAKRKPRRRKKPARR